MVVEVLVAMLEVMEVALVTVTILEAMEVVVVEV